MSLQAFTVTIQPKEDSPFNVIPNAPIEIRERLANDTSGSLSLIFSDSAGLNPITQTGATANALGQFTFYAAAEAYNAVYDNNGTPVTIPVDVGVTGAILNSHFGRLEPDTLAIWQTDTSAADGDVVTTKERTAGNGGGATGDVIAGTGTANGLNIVAHNTLSLSWALRVESPLDVKALGAVNGADISAILTNAISLNSQVLVKDLAIKMFEVSVADGLKLTFLNSTLSPISGLTGGTTGNPHRMILGTGFDDVTIIGVNSTIETSEYYPASTVHPATGTFERVSGIDIVDCTRVLIDGFHLDQISQGGINCLQLTPSAMSDITVRNITGEKAHYAFKAIFVGGEIEASKSKNITIQNIVLNGGGRVPTELGEDAGFDFGTSSVDHVQVKNCDIILLDNISSTFACGIGVRVEKCTNINDSSIVVQESGQGGLQYYNTGTQDGQSSQPIIKRWGRIPNLSSVRMFGGTPYLMLEAVANNTVADPSVDARFVSSPYTIANTAGIPAYDTALTGTLTPFRGYGGVDVVHKAQLISVDNPLCLPATDTTGPTFDYASDHGFNMIHSNNAPITTPTVARLTNGARINGNVNNLNAPKFMEPVNLGLSKVSLRVSSLPEEPNNLSTVNDFGTMYHVTGGASGVNRNVRMARTDIAMVLDSDVDSFVESWLINGTKTWGFRVIRADDPAKIIQVNFGGEAITFGINGSTVATIDAAGISSASGATGTFTSADAKTITVTGGIITSIV